MSGRVKLFVVVGVLFSVILLSLFFAQPVSREYKAWRARLLSADAGALIEMDLLLVGEAEEIMRRASELCPSGIEVLRVTARIAEIKGSYADALDLWQQIVGFSSSEARDRKSLIRLGIKLNKYVLVKQELEKLKLKIFYADSDVHVFLIQLFIASGRYDDALFEARKLLEIDKDYPVVDTLFLARNPSGPLQTHQDIDRAMMLKLASDADILGLQALRHLASYKGADEMLMNSIADFLEKHKDAEVEDFILACSLRLKSKQEDLLASLAKVKNFLDLNKDEELMLFGAWLNEFKMYEKTLQYIDPARAMDRNELLVLRLEALTGLNEWQVLFNILKQEKLPLEEYMKHVFLANYYLEAGSKVEAEREWEKALSLSVRNIDDCWSIFEFAEKKGLHEFARIALNDLIRKPSSMREAFERLIQLDLNAQNLENLLGTYKALVSIYPREPVFLADFYYLKLLMNEDLPDIPAATALLFEASPRSLTCRVIHALACFKNDSSLDAFNAIAGTQVNWMSVAPRSKLIAYVILKRNGRLANAQKIASVLNVSELMFEEQQLYKMAEQNAQ